MLVLILAPASVMAAGAGILLLCHAQDLSLRSLFGPRPISAGLLTTS